MNSAYNDDEVYLSIAEDMNNPQEDKRIKVKYKFQRDLVVEYFLLAIENKSSEKYGAKIKRSRLNVIKDDIIVPPKAILSYRIYLKIGSQHRPVNFTLGVNNICVHEYISEE